MQTLGKYIIDLNALNTDVEKRQMILDDAFFTELDQTEIVGGQVTVDMIIKPVAGNFDISFHAAGTVDVPCDRCLQALTLPIDFDDSLKVKLGEEDLDEGDVITVDEKTGAFDVSWNLYELIELSLPMQRVHAEGDCDEEMINLLAAHLTENGQSEDNNKINSDEIN